jgi:CheY-like chemotaxis protein
MGKRVLIIDNNSDTRSVVLSAIPTAHIVSHASHGDEAQAMLAEASERLTPYHLVIIDLDLPGISGLEVVSLLRLLEEPRKLAGRPLTTKILALSDSPNGELIYGANALACDVFLVKPVDLARLQEAVEQLCPLD